MADRTKRWFENLSLAAQVVLAVLVLVLLLTVLSPLAAVAAALAFGVSVIALIVRVSQRRSVKRWGIAAVASLALAGVSDALYGGGSGTGENRGAQAVIGGRNGAGSFDDPADMRLCLGGDGPEDYSGPPLDFRVVDNEVSEAPSGTRMLTLVAATSLYEDLDAIAQNLAVNPDEYDAVEVTIFPREWAFYTPSQGVQPLPGVMDFVYNTYYVAHSPAGETAIGLPDENLHECGSSYEDGGYKWGIREMY